MVVATVVSRHDASAQRAESPDSLRERFRLELADAARAGSSVEAAGPLAAARSTASAYAAQWRDPVLLRQLSRFQSWSPRDRAAKAAADSLRFAGFILFPRGGTTAAMPLWRTALGLARSIGDSAGMAAVLGNLGAGFMVEGELDSAIVYLYRARRIAERLDDRRTLGNALGALGSVAKARGHHADARKLYAEALAVRQRSGDDRGAAADENNLGLVSQALRDTAGARRFFESALARNRSAGRAGEAATNLVNLANLFLEDGHDSVATVVYRQALAMHRAARQMVGAGLDLRGLGGIALRQGDYPSAIASLTEAVGTLDSTGPRAESVGARLDLAEALAAAGELGRASSILDSADAASLEEDPALLATIEVLRGDLAADVGEADDAGLAYARAESLYTLAGDLAGVAVARQGRGMILLRSGDAAGAARMLRAAARDQREAGELRGAALTDVMVGVSDAERGSITAARAGLRRARGRLHNLGDPVGEAAALDALGDIQARTGRGAAAERSYRAGLRVLGTRRAPAVATSLHWGLGRLLRAGGRRRGATGEFGIAVDEMETMAARMPSGARRTSLLGTASELYAELAALQHEQGNDGAAFESSERLRARQMRESIAARRGPQAGLSPVSTAAVSSHLAPDEALLEYLVADSTTILFVITARSVRTLTLPVGRNALHAAVDFARAAIARGPARMVAEPWAPPMRRLRRLLIEPAEATGMLRGVHRLIVAPHAELHYLPFAALLDRRSGRYLVEQYDIAYVPSAGVWLTLQGRRPPAGTGVLAMAPFPTSLPGSRDEVRMVQTTYGTRAIALTGAVATQRAFVEGLTGRSIIHLATYGVLNRRNPASSFVAFAPDGQDDGRLTVTEVLGLSFRARLVVLSACETAVAGGAFADVPAGDDWVGLVRAFLVAGADDVMASLWPVEDRPTSRMMQRVYAALGRGDPTAALAAAQRAALRDSATSAPRHWAALVVVGAARRTR